MKSRDMVIGLVVLAVLGGVLYYRKNKAMEETVVPQTLSIEKEMEEKFKMEIPDDVDKVELIDITAGNSSGIATKNFSNGKFETSVLVDLPDTKSGEFYQAWLVKGDKMVSLGKLKSAKGGWMIEFESATDYSDYDKFMVTLEKTFNSAPEKTILEGSF